MASWYRITALAGAVPTVYIYDEIGLFGVNVSDFANDLRALGNLKGKPLKVRINSPGGDVFGGYTIMALLRDTGANITVYIDGVAASMASAIAMTGDTVIMAEGAMMMIHNPSGVFEGGSIEMQAAVTLLDGVKDGMITAYAKKSKLSREDISAIMDAETWLTAEQAVEKGFADSIGEVVKVAAFDLTRYSKNPPKDNPEAETKEADMALTKDEMDGLAAAIGGALTAANKPVMDALAALKPVTAKAKDEADEGAGKTEADIRKEIMAENAARATDITELCALAGLPNLAAGFIAGAQDVTAVRAALKAEKAKKPAPRNHTGAALGDGETAEQGDISDLIPKARTGTQIWAQFNAPKAKQGRPSAH